jgi:cytidylate kinase
MKESQLSARLSEVLLRASEYKELSGSAGKEPPALPYLITISREPGALGTTVARAVGKLLGWPVYDRELLDRVAEEMGTRVDHLQRVDERPVSWLEECVRQLTTQYNLSQDRYMVHLITTLRGLAQQGNCVIVGRGANFVVPHETALNVRLVADYKDRMAVLQQLLKVSEKEAARWEKKSSRERFDFVKRRFGKDVSDPHFYDLVLNTSRLSADESAEVIVAALHRLQARKPDAKVQPAKA